MLFSMKVEPSFPLSVSRYALNDMDKFSLKDSGRGDSEAGDSDYEAGRESPIDRLLGEAFTELYPPDGQHRPHPQHPHAGIHPSTHHPSHLKTLTLQPTTLSPLYISLLPYTLVLY